MATARNRSAGLSKKEIDKNRREGLKSMEEQFLVCRELMHAWDEIAAYVSQRRGGRAREITEIFRCMRCKTVRKDRVLGSSYELLGRTYTHPDGYILRGAGFTLRADVRAEKFNRHAPSDIPPGEDVLQDLADEMEQASA